MTPRPLIFISAVSRELRSARQLVANTLVFLGYEPVWQDMFGTESGDLRSVLRQKIDQCKGVVQLVGCCYGTEPSTVDEQFGRVSYAQYEALYARQRHKKIWYLFIDEHFPVDPCEGESAELRELQASYRRRVQSDTHVFHPLATTEGLEASVLRLRDDLTRLRRGVKQWAVGVLGLLVVIGGLVVWQLHSQAQMKIEISKLRQGILEYPKLEAQVRGSRTEANSIAIQEQIYAELGRQLGVDPKILRERLPQFAAGLKHAPNVSTYERANAAYVAKDYVESERLALQAAEDAHKSDAGNSRTIWQALELAGLSAHRQIQYSRATHHFREAEKFTDSNRDLDGWGRLQQEIGDLLVDQGNYSDGEKVFRGVIEARSRVLGREHPDTLSSRHRLIVALTRQSKHAAAEAEAREVLKLREKILGAEHADTVASRYNLACTLIDEGKRAEAEDLFREVIRLSDKGLGLEHPRSIAARVGLAMTLEDEGKGAEAEALYREVIHLDEKVYGPDHPNTLNDRMNLATALQANGKYTQAEAEYRDVISREAKLIGAEHPDILTSRNNLAELLDDEGKFAEAEAECRQIINVETRVLGPNHRLTLNTRANLAIALIGQGKFDEAAVECKSTTGLMEQALGLEHPDLFDFTSKFIMALSRQRRITEAIELARSIEQKATKVLGPNHGITQRYAKLLRDAEARK